MYDTLFLSFSGLCPGGKRKLLCIVMKEKGCCNLEILKVENLSKIYGAGEARVDALKHVSFSMERGEFGAVVGASGSGKSTLLNCIGGLDSANEGKLTEE